ncbi:MAG: FeoB-associated Cys-rich membrane protein [Eubacterium sp.]|nr:FeoB-associated Cys-rich membrane protein [Eubacterium sp.]
MDWSSGILPSVILGGILAIMIVRIIMSKLKEHKNGTCGCGCPGCNGSCHPSAAAGREQKEEKE